MPKEQVWHFAQDTHMPWNIQYKHTLCLINISLSVSNNGITDSFNGSDFVFMDYLHTF